MNQIAVGDCRKVMASLIAEDVKVQTCVTSPPYWGLRDYGVEGQLGLEPTPEEYVANMVEVFRLVRDLLSDDGTLWLNLGDSYSGSGKGGNPDEGKQATNKGSQSIGVLYGKTGETARKAALTNVSRRWTTEQGIPAKNLVGIPWRVAFALQADDWYLRQDIIWAKPNPMPESVRDRCTKAHEYIFLFAKRERYYFDQIGIAEPCVAGDNGSSYTSKYDIATKPGLGTGPRKQRKPAGWDTGAGGHGSFHREGRAQEVEYTEAEGMIRNKRSVWTVATLPYSEAHFATFPPELIKPCILAGSRPGDIVFDPFMGSGTTAKVALELGRQYLGCELNPDYIKLSNDRTKTTMGLTLHAR